MRETTVAMPVLALVAMTRGMLGAGLGLLLADRMTREQRRTLGWSLFLVGAVTTPPLMKAVLGKSRKVVP